MANALAVPRVTILSCWAVLRAQALIIGGVDESVVGAFGHTTVLGHC